MKDKQDCDTKALPVTDRVTLCAKKSVTLSVGLSGRFKATRDHVGKSQSEMDDWLRIGKKSWQRCESGNHSPGSKIVTALIERGISANWLLSGVGPMLLKDLPQPGYQEGNYRQEPDDYEYIKVSSVTSTTTEDGKLTQEIVARKVAFRRDWLSKKGLLNMELSFFRARGDSMEPTIIEGDSALVLTYYLEEEESGGRKTWPGLYNISEFPGNGIYLVRLEDRLSIKRVQMDGRGGLSIISDNPAWETINFAADEIKRFLEAKNSPIIGKVEWIGRSI